MNEKSQGSKHPLSTTTSSSSTTHSTSTSTPSTRDSDNFSTSPQTTSPASPSFPSFYFPRTQTESSARGAKPLRSPERLPTYPPPSPSSDGENDACTDYNASLLRSSTSSTTAKSSDSGRIKKTHSEDFHKNAYTECGRHSDDWLFGGVSVTKTLKGLWEKRR
jgi:hypothetical protein